MNRRSEQFGRFAPPVAPGRIPIIGHLGRLLANPLTFIRSLRTTGDVVIVYGGTKPMYMVNSAELVRAILVPGPTQCRRGASFDTASRIFGNSLIIAEDEAHRRQRRIMQPFFYQRQIDQYVGLMAEGVNERCSSWEPGVELEIATEMREIGLRSLSRVLFHSKLSEASLATIHELFPTVLKGLAVLSLYPASWMERVPTPLNRKFRSVFPRMQRVVDQIISDYRSAGITDGDLLAKLLAARDNESGDQMSPDEVRDQIITLLFVGTETTATTLAWLFYQLFRHPSVEKRLVDEVSTVLGSDQIQSRDLARLSYTDHVLTEVLRLHTPNWLLMRRTEREITLNGFRIPANVDILFSLNAIHRDPRLFDDPCRFNPERWAYGRADHLPKGAFIPFGTGNHKCIGDKFAWTQMKVATATILRRWKMTPSPGRTVKERAWITVQPHGLTIIPHRVGSDVG